MKLFGAPNSDLEDKADKRAGNISLALHEYRRRKNIYEASVAALKNYQELVGAGLKSVERDHSTMEDAHRKLEEALK